MFSAARPAQQLRHDRDCARIHVRWTISFRHNPPQLGVGWSEEMMLGRTNWKLGGAYLCDCGAVARVRVGCESGSGRMGWVESAAALESQQLRRFNNRRLQERRGSTTVKNRGKQCTRLAVRRDGGSKLEIRSCQSQYRRAWKRGLLSPHQRAGSRELALCSH
jgi:hypothetical protein